MLFIFNIIKLKINILTLNLNILKQFKYICLYNKYVHCPIKCLYGLSCAYMCVFVCACVFVRVCVRVCFCAWTHSIVKIWHITHHKRQCQGNYLLIKRSFIPNCSFFFLFLWASIEKNAFLSQFFKSDFSRATIKSFFF